MVTVLGGGISGLSAAYYLLRRLGQPVFVYDSSNRLGGWLRTEHHRDKGFQFEAGPRTIRPKGLQGANTLALIEDLNLKVKAIPSDHPAARNRMIFAKGQLCTMPNSLGGVLKTIPPFSKPLAIALLRDLFTGGKRSKHGDESIYDFVERRFGKELAEYAISPLICGICAGDAKEISVRFLLNELYDKEQRWGGVIRGMVLTKLFGGVKKDQLTTAGVFGSDPLPTLYEKAKNEKWSMYSLEGGIEALPKALASYLEEHDVSIKLSSECRKMTFSEDGVKMHIKDQVIAAPYVVSAIPSFKLAAAVKEQHPSLAALLLCIPYVDVAVVNLQYNADNILKMKAFGFLAAPAERLPILGVTFDSCSFDMKGNTVLTVMMGGRWFQKNFGKNPTQKELLDIALYYVQQILGVKEEPKTFRVHVLKKCIPQYTVGHQERVENIRRYIDNYHLPISVCGAAYDGVGINDVILSSRAQVQGLVSV